MKKLLLAISVCALLLFGICSATGVIHSKEIIVHIKPDDGIVTVSRGGYVKNIPISQAEQFMKRACTRYVTAGILKEIREIAEKDEKVKKELEGKNYEIMDVGILYGRDGAYGIVKLKVNDSYYGVTVDMKNKTLTSFEKMEENKTCFCTKEGD